MRFLNQRDQVRAEASFATIWLVLSAALVPMELILQTFVEPAFLWWTHGKIAFDALLFGALSLNVLVFALAQPAMVVIIGHNLLGIQLILSLLAGMLAVGGCLYSFPSPVSAVQHSRCLRPRWCRLSAM